MDTARSTNGGSRAAAGAATRGKYTLVTSWGLLTSTSLPRTVAVEK